MESKEIRRNRKAGKKVKHRVRRVDRESIGRDKASAQVAHGEQLSEPLGVEAREIGRCAVRAAQ